MPRSTAQILSPVRTGSYANVLTTSVILLHGSQRRQLIRYLQRHGPRVGLPPYILEPGHRGHAGHYHRVSHGLHLARGKTLPRLSGLLKRPSRSREQLRMRWPTSLTFGGPRRLFSCFFLFNENLTVHARWSAEQSLCHKRRRGGYGP